MKTAALLLALLLSGCAAHRPAPTTTLGPFPVKGQVAEGQTPAAPRPDSSHAKHSENNRYASPSTLKPGFLSSLGNVFSTPQGRANRQAVRIARAAVPRSIGKGAVYAVNSRVTNGGNKPTGPVTQADSGATVSNAAANAQQQTVKGNGNKLQAKQANPTQQAKGWAASLVDNLTGWIPWVIGGALVLAVVFRKRLPVVGPFFS